jgi:DNA-binding transcriptional LysR family regulator
MLYARELRMEPEWSDLKIILALSRAGSVAGAARALGVDQSTISRRLTALEESVGARLLLRGGREFAFTTEGRAMCNAAEAMEAAIGEASRAVRVAKLEVSGTVRVSSPPAFVPELMIGIVRLRERYPALDVQISGSYGTVDLAKGEADMAVRGFKPTEPDLVARKLTDAAWGVFASRAYADAKGLPKNHGELSKHALVVYQPSMHTVAALRWMDDHRGDATQLTRVDNLEIASEVIGAGAGCGVLPAFVASKRSDLVSVFPEKIWQNTIYCVFHESARDTARVRAAFEMFATYFEACADKMLGKAFFK